MSSGAPEPIAWMPQRIRDPQRQKRMQFTNDRSPLRVSSRLVGAVLVAAALALSACTGGLSATAICARSAGDYVGGTCEHDWTSGELAARNGARRTAACFSGTTGANLGVAAPNRGASKLASHDAVDRLVEVDHLDGVLVDSDSAELPFVDRLDLQGNAALQRAWARRDRIPVCAPAPIDARH
jgi:hypothetical protein